MLKLINSNGLFFYYVLKNEPNTVVIQDFLAQSKMPRSSFYENYKSKYCIYQVLAENWIKNNLFFLQERLPITETLLQLTKAIILDVNRYSNISKRTLVLLRNNDVFESFCIVIVKELLGIQTINKRIKDYLDFIFRFIFEFLILTINTNQNDDKIENLLLTSIKAFNLYAFL